jgi:phage shock protein A
MSFFSRLTDIVTCNLTEILANESDPETAVQQIIDEMQEGLAGAERSMRTARGNEQRLSDELEELGAQVDTWTVRATQALQADNETAARDALLRKTEVEDLIAGLEMEFSRAAETRIQLQTTVRGLEARMADARRKQQQLLSGNIRSEDVPADTKSPEPIRLDESRSRQIDDELAALKKQLGK